MNNILHNDKYLDRLFKHKITKGIVCTQCIMDTLSLDESIKFTLKRVLEIPIREARLIIDYWEENQIITEMLEKHGVTTYEIAREYKKGRATPGRVSITFYAFNEDFLSELITRHYGSDFSLPGSIQVWPYLVADTGRNEVIAMKLYDDRGYYEYHIMG